MAARPPAPIPSPPAALSPFQPYLNPPRTSSVRFRLSPPFLLAGIELAPSLSLSAVAVELRSAAVVAPDHLPPRRRLLRLRRILADLVHPSVSLADRRNAVDPVDPNRAATFLRSGRLFRRHRHGGAAAERGEGKGEKKRRSTAHPRSTATTKNVAGAEEGGGAARVDGVDSVPAVGERNGGVDEVGEDAAKPKEAAPRWEVVRGDDGGGPELDGDGGERATARARFRRGGRAARGGNGRRRRREAAGFAAAAALGRGRGGGSGGRKGMTGGPHPSARVAGGPARQWRARGERPDGPRGEEREGEGDGPSRPKREREGKGSF
uniref:Pr1-like protein n=1 Tax=Oryza sativa subsp. japonica TaxID=39947 RepID=Q6AT78_ORYSJ|nr:hypothetical protein [Oryza sativa Japonica Group]AAV32139.1 hypothetical protein [Oryza sativa Japonica Group]